MNSSGVVTGITVTNPGSDYATAPNVLIASPNLPSLPDGSYSATAIQYDVAGNPSQAVQFGNTGAVVIDGTDSPNHGDANGPGGTNENAWFYMQQVLNVIEPNITATSKTLVVLGATRQSPVRWRWRRRRRRRRTGARRPGHRLRVRPEQPAQGWLEYRLRRRRGGHADVPQWAADADGQSQRRRGHLDHRHAGFDRVHLHPHRQPSPGRPERRLS